MSRSKKNKPAPTPSKAPEFTFVGDVSKLPDSFFRAVALVLLDAHDREKRATLEAASGSAIREGDRTLEGPNHE